MRSLDGLRILLTRSQCGCREWAGRIEARGGAPVSFPCIQTVLLDPAGGLAGRLSAAIAKAHWLALTSARGVQAVDRLVAAPLPSRLAIAAVGPSTAAAARAHLGRVDLVSAAGTAAALGIDLAERLDLEQHRAPRVVVAAAVGGRRDVEQVLEPRGVAVTRVDVYRTEPAPALEPRQSLDSVDVVLLASPSAVDGLRARADLSSRIPIVSIGPSTTAAARAVGMRVAAEAEQRSLEAMLEAIP